MVDEVGEEEEYVYARHAGQAPEVDGICLLKDDSSYEAGQLVPVRCVDCDEYELVVERVE